MSITTLLTLLVSSMLIYSAPLIFTSIGGVFSERGGVVNVGLEGIMVMGAFSGVVFNLEFAEQLGAATPWISLLVAGIVGAIFSLIHAVATVHFRADHVVSGTVLNLMAPALAVFLVKVLYNKGQTDNLSQTFGRFDFPVLADIPVIGDIFFKSTSLLGYIAIAFSFLAWFILFKTRFGLRLRSVGEHPQAADTLGINVYKMRYLGVVISGFLGGIGGAIYAQSISVNFSVTTIVGPGFIALAAMIFGKWNPIGAMLSSLFFGLSQSLAVIGSQLPFLQGVPAVYLQIAPYVLTILVLAAFFGKAVAPKADGINYIALATNAVRSGIIAAHNACGTAIESIGVQGSNGISIYGLHLISTGLTAEKAAKFGYEVETTSFEDNQRPEFMKENDIVKIKIVYDKKSRRVLGMQCASRYDMSMVNHMFSLAIQEHVTIDRIALLDIFFLPHFNKPYNYITMAALTAK